jgi:hypothetical protein
VALEAPVTDLGDETCRRLFRTLANYEDGARFMESISFLYEGRRVAIPRVQGYWLIEDAVARLCAVVEEYVELRFKDGQAHFLGTGGTAAQWRANVVKVEGSWKKREDVWLAAFGINLVDSPDHAPMLGYVQARNAFVHGLGILTDFQVALGYRVIDELTSAGIPVSGRAVVMVKESVSRCTYTARDFVLFVDRSAPF